MTAHVHRAVFVGRVEGEVGPGYPSHVLRHCGACGTLLEEFDGEVAEIVPELARSAGIGPNAPVVYVPRDADPAPVTAVEAATAWLHSMLAGGPRPSAWLRTMAGVDQHAWRTVERARDLLGLVVSKSSGRWTWALPELGGVVGGVENERSGSWAHCEENGD